MCNGGYLDCLKYLFSIENQFKIKLDTTIKNENFASNGLLLACRKNHRHVVDYLIKNVYNLTMNNNFVDESIMTTMINQKDKNNHNSLWYCARYGNLNAIKVIFSKYSKYISLHSSSNKSTHDSIEQSIFGAACHYNQFKCVLWFLSNQEIRNKIDLSTKDKYGKSILMDAIEQENEQTVAVLCDYSYKTKISRDDALMCLNIAAICGNVSIFCNVMLVLFNQYNIKDMQNLEKKMILNENKIDSLLDICNKYQNYGLMSFLVNMQENGIKSNNFSFILSLLKHNRSNSTASENKISKDDYVDVAKYLYSHLSKSCLAELKNVIKNSLLRNECQFDDSLLHLVNLIANNDNTVTDIDTKQDNDNCDKSLSQQQQQIKNELLKIKKNFEAQWQHLCCKIKNFDLNCETVTKYKDLNQIDMHSALERLQSINKTFGVENFNVSQNSVLFISQHKNDKQIQFEKITERKDNQVLEYKERIKIVNLMANHDTNAVRKQFADKSSKWEYDFDVSLSKLLIASRQVCICVHETHNVFTDNI